jgi:propionyl-CoA synthetase
MGMMFFTKAVYPCSVVFGGFASHELAVRIDDARPAVILAGSAGLEGASKVVQYQPLLEGALAQSKHKVSKVIMKQRPQAPAKLQPGRDVDWDEEMNTVRQRRLFADPVWVDSTHPQYIIYTSGSTGTPKGVVRDTGGHAVALKWSMQNVYGLQPGGVWWAAS